MGIDETIVYFVSGYMRTGTSMMMQALEAGGLEVVRSTGRSAKMNSKFGKPDLPKPYFPNDDYYELNEEDYKKPKFPKGYEGKLVKCLYGKISSLPTSGRYRVVFMRRSRESIIMSCVAFWGYPPKMVLDPKFDAQMSTIVERLRDRKSFISVDEVWYHAVLQDSLGVFKGLDWPINPKLAAKIPTTKKARFDERD